LPKYDDVNEEDCMTIDKCSKDHVMEKLDKSKDDKTCTKCIKDIEEDECYTCSECQEYYHIECV
jgi:hypothetical protein